MLLRKMILFMCILLVYTGCVSSGIQNEIEDKNMNIEEKDLFTDEKMMKQIREINRLFVSDNITVTGDAASFGGDFSSGSLRSHLNENKQIDWQLHANQPKYISQMALKYNQDGNVVEFNMKNRKKYAATAGYHIVDRHVEKELMDQVFYQAQQEDDGYWYVKCSVCDSYMGSYGRRLSKEFSGKQTDWKNYHILLKWFKMVEDEALSHKEISDMVDSDITKYEKGSFYFKKVLFLDGIIYSYMPFSVQGTKLEVAFSPASVCYPIKMKKIVSQLNESNLILSHFKYKGKLLLLEYENVNCYYNENYETFAGSRFQNHSKETPMRAVISFDNQLKLNTISANTVNVIIGSNGLPTEFTEELIKIMGVFDIHLDNAKDAINTINAKIQEYFREELAVYAIIGDYPALVAYSPPTKLGPLHGKAGTLYWRFILRGTQYGEKGWVEYTFHK